MRLHDPELRTSPPTTTRASTPRCSRPSPTRTAATDRLRRGRLHGRLGEVVRDEFGSSAAVYPVFNGTGANVVSLTAMLPRWGAVIASSTAHINTDEGGAPERVSGLKLLTVPTPDGKLTPDLIATEAWGWAMSTALSRSPSASPRAPSSVPSTRRARCGPSPTSRTRRAWPCTWTAPASERSRRTRRAVARLHQRCRGRRA